MSAVAYLTIGALLARAETQPRVRTFIMLSAIILTFVVCLSRIYLGVHWPTDVLAEWCRGSASAMGCWAALLRCQRKGYVT